jgi:hypothetical protein
MCYRTKRTYRLKAVGQGNTPHSRLIRRAVERFENLLGQVVIQGLLKVVVFFHSCQNPGGNLPSVPAWVQRPSFSLHTQGRSKVGQSGGEASINPRPFEGK